MTFRSSPLFATLVVLAACDASPEPATTTAPLVQFPNDQNNLCFGPQQPMGAVSLPGADGKQGALGSELWFDMAELHTTGGHHLGVIAYFFQFDLSFIPGYGRFTLEILAITDLTSGVHQHRIVTSFGPDYPTHANRYSLANSEGWTMYGSNGVGGFSGSLAATDDSEHDYELELTTHTLKDPIPQFHDGAIDYGTTAEGYPRGTQTLFSRTRLAVAGSVIIDGEAQLAFGRGWSDRQTGIYNQVAGRWFGIQLDDGIGGAVGTDITAFELRDAVTGQLIDRVGTIAGRAPACAYVPLTRNDLALSYDYSDAYVSSLTGKRYPRRGTLDIARLDTHLTITSYALGEIDYGGGITQSPSRVSGTYRGKRVTGFAYLEVPGVP